MARISKISIEGFKSIKSLKDFELNAGLNILIGANGAGKSNLISFFKFLNSIVNERVQLVTKKLGGTNNILYNGSKVTSSFRGEVYFDWNGYIFNLEPTQSGSFVFETEKLYFDGMYGVSRYSQGSGHEETNLYNVKQGIDTAKNYVIPALKSWVVYHFHDTSDTARVKQKTAINNNVSLEMDAANLAPFLYKLKETNTVHYKGIVKAVQMIAPYFKDFHLRPDPFDESSIQLEWLGFESDQPFTGHQLSDGTLRFICLATVLLQPTPPSTIIIDEPELGLHPYALAILGSLFRSASANIQLVLSTQSVQLVNEFSPEDIIVVERDDDQTKFKKLEKDTLENWLSEYSLGDLWEKNIIGGRPE